MTDGICLWFKLTLRYTMFSCCSFCRLPVNQGGLMTSLEFEMVSAMLVITLKLPPPTAVKCTHPPVWTAHTSEQNFYITDMFHSFITTEKNWSKTRSHSKSHSLLSVCSDNRKFPILSYQYCYLSKNQWKCSKTSVHGFFVYYRSLLFPQYSYQ